MKINVSQLLAKLDLYSYFLGLFGSLIPLNVCRFLTANYSLRPSPLQWLFVWLFVSEWFKKINCTKVLHSVWARVRAICIEKKVTILRGNVTHAALRCQFGNVGTKTCTWVRARCPRLNNREFFNICPEKSAYQLRWMWTHAISGRNSLHPEPLALGLELLRRRRLPGVWQRSGQGGERCHLRVHAPP